MNWSTLDIASADCQLKTASVTSPQAACAVAPLSSAPAATAEKSNRLTLFPPLTRDPLMNRCRTHAVRRNDSGPAGKPCADLPATRGAGLASYILYILKLQFSYELSSILYFLIVQSSI